MWTVAAALGIAALLQASAVAFLVLKIAGAIYLVWIGIQMLRARDPAAAATAAGHGVAPHARGGKALRQGLLSDLSNPKIAVFFTSFLPQFVHGDGPVFAAFLMLGLTFAVITLAWLAAYGDGGRPCVRRAAPAVGAQDARPHHRRRADRVRRAARVREALGGRRARCRVPQVEARTLPADPFRGESGPVYGAGAAPASRRSSARRARPSAVASRLITYCAFASSRYASSSNTSCVASSAGVDLALGLRVADGRLEQIASTRRWRRSRGRAPGPGRVSSSAATEAKKQPPGKTSSSTWRRKFSASASKRGETGSARPAPAR